MGRSVWTHAGTVGTTYLECTGGFCPKCSMACYGWICDECGGDLEPDAEAAQWEFDALVDGLREVMREHYPSFEIADHWPERESHCILESDLCQVCISEYMGMVAIDVVPRLDHGRYDLEGIATAWCETHALPFIQKTFGQFRKLATFSNGEAVFEEIQR